MHDQWPFPEDIPVSDSTIPSPALLLMAHPSTHTSWVPAGD